MKLTALVTITAGMLAATAANAQTVQTEADVATATLPQFRATVDAERKYPKVTSSYMKDGVFVRPADVLMVAPGLTKEQVYQLVGTPHFDEGLFAVRTWNYVFNFYNGQGSEFTSCQFQIRYDRHARVENTFWKDQRCADLVEGK